MYMCILSGGGGSAAAVLVVYLPAWHYYPMHSYIPEEIYMMVVPIYL